MNKKQLEQQIPLLSCTGFTLTEVLIVIAVLAILTSFALPPFVEWRQNLIYKQATSEIANSFKSARSKAITLNKQHGVELTKTDRSYQFHRYSSTTKEWVNYGTKGTVSSQVNLVLHGSDPLNIRFNMNGSTFDNYSIRIKDTNTNRYTIYVQRSGRIKVYKSK